MKKTIAILLVLVMVLLTVACSNVSENVDDETTTAEQLQNTPVVDETTTAEETTAADIADTLEEKNFNNATYTVIDRKSTSKDFISEDLTGDLISDAVYDRNHTVEDRFGVKIDVIEEAGQWEDRDSFVAKLSASFLSGTHDYDLITTHSGYIVIPGLKGYAYNIAELENIDLSKRWWCPEYTDVVTVNGAVYSAVGDISYTLYQYMHGCFFNKRLVAEYNIPDLYDLVSSGGWTFDKMKEYTLGISGDLDGNGKFEQNDLYGAVMNNHALRICATTFDTKMTVLDTATGQQVINLPNDKYIEAYERLYDYVNNNSQSILYIKAAESCVAPFMNGNIMMFIGRLGDAESLKDMKDEYGIIPLPKYDSNQENYISGARDYMSAEAIMGNIVDEEMVGTITEALCMYGYKIITPAYYETALKLKYTSDATAMSMLDLIRDTLTFDFAMVYTSQISTAFSIMGDKIEGKVTNISSLLKSNAKIWPKEINKIYDSYSKIK